VTEFVGPELLRPDHSIQGFDCGDGALNWWLGNKARHNQTETSSRTWVVTDGERVIAFYASSTAVILRSAATKRAARNQPDPLPAVLLGRLAVDIGHQRKGLGEALLKHFILKSLEVAQLTGVRVLLVHAKDDAAAAFYRRYGFESSPIDDLTLMMLVKDILAPTESDVRET
jgi:GNAT superfamily N-acetyltransferase